MIDFRFILRTTRRRKSATSYELCAAPEWRAIRKLNRPSNANQPPFGRLNAPVRGTWPLNSVVPERCVDGD